MTADQGRAPPVTLKAVTGKAATGQGTPGGTGQGGGTGRPGRCAQAQWAFPACSIASAVASSASRIEAWRFL